VVDLGLVPLARERRPAPLAPDPVDHAPVVRPEGVAGGAVGRGDEAGGVDADGEVPGPVVTAPLRGGPPVQVDERRTPRRRRGGARPPGVVDADLDGRRRMFPG